MKKLALMTSFALIMFSGTALAEDMNTTVTVTSGIQNIGIFSLTLFAFIMGGGFLVTIMKLLYTTNEKTFLNDMFAVVIIGLILVAALGILL